MSVEDRVLLGARLLDEEYPDWFKNINLETLDMHSTNDDILGQLYGSFPEGVSTLKLSFNKDQDISHGFEVDVEDDSADDREEYKQLLQFWAREVTVRLEAEAKK